MVALRVSGHGTYTDYPCSTVAEAQRLAGTSGWLWDASVKDFSTFLFINDYDARTVWEYDAEGGRWYSCEMAVEARP
jgi:hypothetical protein